jgi:hypothetical protein
MERDEAGVLVVSMNDGAGGPITFTALDHTEFTEAFYRIGRDMGNKVVILTGATDFMGAIDFATFLNDPDPDAGLRVYDEGVQIIENLLNIHVPVIAAIEGQALIHTEYALTANVVVAEVVEDGTTLQRARELAHLYLQKPEVTRRNTRVHFTQPLKEEIVARVGFGLTLEAASIGALVQAMNS